MASLFLGYNYMLSSNGLIGAQLEGTLANTRVNLNGSSSSTFVDTSVFIPEGGAAETRTHTATGTFSGLSNTLDNRWLLSALARAGFLVDPGDLVYVIGGYTYGRFETFGTGFGMNGGTIGVGWERQIVQGWNIRGEYRYTRFSNATVSRAQTNTTSNAFGKFDETITSTFNTAGHFSVWICIRYGLGCRIVSDLSCGCGEGTETRR